MAPLRTMLFSCLASQKNSKILPLLTILFPVLRFFAPFSLYNEGLIISTLPSSYEDISGHIHPCYLPLFSEFRLLSCRRLVLPHYLLRDPFVPLWSHCCNAIMLPSAAFSESSVETKVFTFYFFSFSMMDYVLSTWLRLRLFPRTFFPVRVELLFASRGIGVKFEGQSKEGIFLRASPLFDRVTKEQMQECLVDTRFFLLISPLCLAHLLHC